MSSLCPKCGKFMEGDICEKCQAKEAAEKYNENVNTLKEEDINTVSHEQSADSENAEELFANEEDIIEIAEEKKKFFDFRIVAALIAVVLIFIGVKSLFGSELSDKKLRQILSDNGYNAPMAEVEEMLDLKDNVKGLEQNEKNKLVLMKNNDSYAVAVINTKTEDFAILTSKFLPLDYVQKEILDMGKNINVQCMGKLKEYIEKYGVDCLENRTYAQEYLREITGPNGCVETKTAQDIITNYVGQIFAQDDSFSDSAVLFEDDSAVPRYYLAETYKLTYNWDYIFDESVYKVWKASTDRSTQNTMEALYGEPYTLKKIWTVANSEFQDLGVTFNSLESAKKGLTQK